MILREASQARPVEAEGADRVIDRASALDYAKKRCLDIAVSAVLVVALAPVMVLIAIAIRVDSAGPAIFRSERVGSRRRRTADGVVWEETRLQMYKFRSMVSDADPGVHRKHIEAFVDGSLAPAGAGARFKLAADKRVTRVGRALRLTSLDELPQLFNVLRGDMSLVGPRPLPPYEVSYHSARDRQRLHALPGITGLWQVSGRADLSYEEMMELDFRYVERQSLLLDLKILTRTLPAVLMRQGAG
jgi:exopolysaccharide production protein ExoY